MQASGSVYMYILSRPREAQQLARGACQRDDARGAQSLSSGSRSSRRGLGDGSTRCSRWRPRQVHQELSSPTGPTAAAVAAAMQLRLRLRRGASPSARQPRSSSRPLSRQARSSPISQPRWPSTRASRSRSRRPLCSRTTARERWDGCCTRPISLSENGLSTPLSGPRQGPSHGPHASGNPRHLHLFLVGISADNNYFRVRGSAQWIQYLRSAAWRLLWVANCAGQKSTLCLRPRTSAAWPCALRAAAPPQEADSLYVL